MLESVCLEHEGNAEQKSLKELIREYRRFNEENLNDIFRSKKLCNLRIFFFNSVFHKFSKWQAISLSKKHEYS